jgi:cobalt/nickel transport system permease protein
MLFSPAPMHIPDGFLTPQVSLVGWLLAAGLIGIAVRQTRHQLGERQIPLMGLLAAFIFAAQAINFPVAAGTSGHLLGGTLAAVVMGPWAAALIMTAVIAVQGLLFQDGGLLVMGWNILNMGILTSFSGYIVYRLVRSAAGGGMPGMLAGGFAGAWLSVELGAIATAFELAASGTSPLSLGLPAMAGVHALIGLGEGIITVGALALLHATRPEILAAGEVAPGRRGAVLVASGMVLAMVVALFSPLASSSPDGLESVAGKQGFLALSRAAPFRLLEGYTIPGINNPAVTTMLAVLAGTLVVFGVAIVLGRLTLSRRHVRG